MSEKLVPQQVREFFDLMAERPERRGGGYIIRFGGEPLDVKPTGPDRLTDMEYRSRLGAARRRHLRLHTLILKREETE